ncbi:two-component system, OmpR family, phosphate regulon sensor histidine kinase PhoR [Allochromatium warmingii]|uniref:Phosphate regulon sensor protein PhoR n=1 Tax=Allochromatium warmingii TaxID=61595 RepID=A0A1H3I909_ALLWA|nr:phosphate regulon sensor histidine kinase PhoR [Allochromatium warmingii]SDY24167.1 two-component system, OmpR family, phosphate regulon sensor histidine kinase PhoR [Allochromatium warmingii]
MRDWMAAGRGELGRAVRFDLALVLAPLALGWLAVTLGADPAWLWPWVLLPPLLRHPWLLIRLALLMRRQHRLAPPFPLGLWGEVYRGIARYQQRGRKSRKRQIRFSRRFREAANAVPDALVILDKQHRIEWANPAAAKLMNIRWPDDDRRSFTDILTQPEILPFIEAGEYMRPLDLAPEHNRTIMLSLRITPFGERKKQRLVVGRDITKIYHLNMIRRDFVANASHELRTPLTVIAGFLENLLDAPGTPEPHRRPLTLMHNQTERMRSIIEDLLTLSRLEMRDSAEEQTAVDVPDELHLILQEAQALSQGRHQFTAQIDEDLLLLGNPPELRSALSNLVFNAVKHTPDGTDIRLLWQRRAEGIEFSVIDDGLGIPAEHLPRLTERFYRVDRARSRESGGTGLGLAIVKHVLNRHDGRLTIASELGHGSRFVCRFAAKRALARTEPQTAAAL